MHFLFGFSKELLVFLRFGHDFLIYSLPFFRKSECWRRKDVGWNKFRQPLPDYGISERNVRFWSLNSRLDNRQADNPFMAMRERYFYGVLPFSFFVVLLGASETVLMIHPYMVRVGHRHWRHGWKKVRISASNRGFDDGCADSLSYGTAAFTTCAFCSLLKAELR